MGSELRSWRNYIDKLDGGKPNAKLATFHARYKFAYNFQGLDVREIRDETLEIYSLVAKIAFAYSALENLEESLKLGHDSKIQARDLVLRYKLKMPDGTGRLERKMYLKNALKNRLDELFQDSEACDVRPLVEQFRHSLFHGKFTPTGWGLKPNSETIELLEGLAQVTLRHADETFTKWLKGQAKSSFQQT